MPSTVKCLFIRFSFTNRDIVGFGQAVLVEGNLDAKTFGSPVLNSSGLAEGVIVSIGDDGFVIPVSSTTNLKTISKSVSEFGNGLKINNYLIQGIEAYLKDDTEQAVSAFGKAKSTTPNGVTAF